MTSRRPRRAAASTKSYANMDHCPDEIDSDFEAVGEPEDDEPYDGEPDDGDPMQTDQDDLGGDDPQSDVDMTGGTDEENGNQEGNTGIDKGNRSAQPAKRPRSDDEERSTKRVKSTSGASNTGPSSRALQRKSSPAVDNANPLRKIAKAVPKKRIVKPTTQVQHDPRSFANPGVVFNFTNILDYKSPPLTTIREIFAHITQKLASTYPDELDALCSKFANTPLKILTFCSGTESPILGLTMVQKCMLALYEKKFLISHEASAEIQPEKAAYIERNQAPKCILRDIIEFVMHKKNNSPEPRMMTTMYGGKIEVPKGCDILVAGFCCDDFSTLNNVQKTLEEKGESGDTFFAVIAYMEMYHPLLVVLENVIGAAPWVPQYDKKTGKRIFKMKNGKEQDKSIQEFCEEAGYYTIFFKVDTKDYYLPQTRLRGYMVCVLKNMIQATEWKTLKEKCVKMVKDFERPASAPVEAFLFKSDDPALKVLHGEARSDRKPVNWDKCTINHEEYRRDLGLGRNHMLTDWKTDGSSVLPDFHVRMSNGTERVLDSLDIAHGRCLQRGFDDRYFNRQLELSQNVYRVQDTLRNGVQQCLTPTNIAFSTVQGRKVVGAEAANLQGIDLGQVNVSNMSESLLHDMCGNAMSSPLVTAIMLAALMTFNSVFTIEGREAVEVEQDPLPCTEGRQTLLVFNASPCQYTPISVEEITTLALYTIRLCLCEGRFAVLDRQFQRCQLCWHTTCIKCGKKPVHEYKLLGKQFLQARKNPIEFEDAIKRAVPMVINLSELYSIKAQNFLDRLRKFATSKDAITWQDMLDAIQNALRSSVRFSSIRRTNVWTVEYTSEAATVKLVITGSGVEWLLYANVSLQPLDSKMGEYLKQYPIARMVPNGKDIVRGKWAYWMPIEKEFKATVTSRGPLNPTYKNTCGLVSALNEFNHSILEVGVEDFDDRYFDTDIRGHYIAAPMCGQAFNTLHVRKSSIAGQQPLGIYFHHTMQSGDPSQHSFLVGSDFERKDWGDYPTAAARFSNSWRQPIVLGVENEDGSRILVQGTDHTIQAYDGAVTDEVSIFVGGRFVDLGAADLTLTGEDFTYRHLPQDVSHLPLSCGHQFDVFECQGKLNRELNLQLPSNVWNIIKRGDRSHFWQGLLWAVLQHLKIKGHLEASNGWHDFVDILHNCVICAPPRPAFVWTVNKQGKNIPYEESEQAFEHEKRIKNRPSPLTVMFRKDDSGSMDLRISMDPTTLMHRARGLLASETDDAPISLSWRLVTDDGRDQVPKLKPLTLLSNEGVKAAKQPFGKFELRPEQLKVLAWMRKQEADGTEFIEEEIVEAPIPEIGYRAEGRATRTIVRHGGILAQDVGFGKTVVTLALIKGSFEAHKTASKSEPESTKIPAGKIPTRASLIIMPPHLVKQWRSEIQKFTPEFLNSLIIIESPGDFANLTIKQIQDAKIVLISWSVPNKLPYVKVLASHAGVVEPVEKPGVREFGAWRKYAVSSLEDSVEVLQKNPEDLVEHVEKKWRANVKKAASVEVRVPSKHITGAAYVNSDKRQTDGSKTKTASSKTKTTSSKNKAASSTSDAKKFERSIAFQEKGKWETMGYAILELFYWERMIVDEYTYGDGLVGVSLQGLVARLKWLLSGTPALGGHSDVKALARLLGINLGVDDFMAFRPDVFKHKTAEFTKAELFLIHQELRSVKWREHRHQLAQHFLDLLCRKDLVNVDHIEMTVHYRLIDQSPSEIAIYLELVQHLAPTDFVIVRNNDKAGDRAKQIRDVLHGSGDGKPALFMRASHFTLDNYEVDSAANLLQAIIRSRKRELTSYNNTLQRLLQKTHWLDMKVAEEHVEQGNPKCKHYVGLRARIQENHFGDLVATRSLANMVQLAADKHHEDAWKAFYRPIGSKDDDQHPMPEYPTGQNASHGVRNVTRMAFELRTAATQANKLIVQIVKQTRDVRFIENIASLQAGSDLTCAHCGINKLQPGDVKIMAECGHLLAESCATTNDCPVNGCTAFNREYQKMAGSTFGQASADSCSAHGSKLDAVVALTKEIEAREEYGLIFCQHHESTDKLAEAFTAAGISYADLRKEATSSDVLEAFQNETEQKHGAKARVMILNIGDANASGSNLTVANHVIFFQPYYTSGENAQARYDAAMTQAIGRARRNGQTKHVHVYHFLTVATIDVDYFEARTDTIIERKPKSPTEGKVKNLKGSVEWRTQLGTWFARLMKFDEAKRKDH